MTTKASPAPVSQLPSLRARNRLLGGLTMNSAGRLADFREELEAIQEQDQASAMREAVMEQLRVIAAQRANPM